MTGPSIRADLSPLNVSAGKLALLINSSDGFEDCWVPFFTLFELYGGGLRHLPIYLNTERATFQRPSLNLTATRTWRPEELVRPTWSQCLRRALESIPEPYVMYFQEDYFLRRQVNDTMILEALAAIDGDSTAGVAYLFRVGPLYMHSCGYNKLFLQVLPPSRYLASTQCAVWRKDFLLSLLRDWENAWTFEIFASFRARKADVRFLAVRPEVSESTPLVDYVYTGVMKGRWKCECVSLFEQHGINVTFSERGMYKSCSRMQSKVQVARKLTARPLSLLRSVHSLLHTADTASRERVHE